MKKSVPPLSSTISRRNLLKLSSLGPLVLAANGTASLGAVGPRFSGRGQSSGSAPAKATSIREFLRGITYRREEVDTFLDPKQPNWTKFDPDLGYTLRTNVLKDGMDESRTLTSYQTTGERTMINYADRLCRINTYGNSFTQCQQASDGETWQEYLAAHLGEPIRNYGVGGYGTYQAYRRMLREEATPRGADYLILNIWDIDDYLRSVDSWFWLRIAPWFRSHPGHLYMFLGHPRVYARLNMATGELVEKENLFRTPESLYQLCDPEYVYEHFRNDLVVKLLVAQEGGSDVAREELAGMARALSIKGDLSSPKATAATARAVHIEYALRAGLRVIEKAQDFARAQQKKLLILLSCGKGAVIRACEGRPRVDQSVVDFLKQKNFVFVDGLSKHLEDFKSFKVSPREYVKRYYIGHYNPRGNHFFGFAIKDAVVNWLEPKPVAYREGSETIPPVV